MPLRPLFSLLLALLVLAFGALAPVTVWNGNGFVSAAMAQDDDDNDDDDDDDDDGDDDDDDARDDDDDDDEIVRRVIVPPAPPAPILPPSPPQRPEPDAELLITLPRDFSIEQVEALGFTVLSTSEIGLIERSVARLALPDDLPLEDARAQLATLFAETAPVENTLYSLQSLPCSQDGCAAMEMVGWDGEFVCEASPRIGIIDTPVDMTNAGLKDGRIDTLSALSPDRQPAPSDHGTSVAGLIVGQPGSTAPGPLPHAELIAVGAFHRGEFGAISADALDVIRAIDMLADHDIDVLNMSLAGEENSLVAEALEALMAQGVSVVAAVGNRGPAAPPQFPAALEGVIAVTAIDAEREIYRQAVHGDHVDFAAPGVQLWTTTEGGGAFQSGTSFAAPLVAAAVALAASPEELSGTALDLGAAGRDPVFGHGLIQFPGCGV